MIRRNFFFIFLLLLITPLGQTFSAQDIYKGLDDVSYLRKENFGEAENSLWKLSRGYSYVYRGKPFSDNDYCQKHSRDYQNSLPGEYVIHGLDRSLHIHSSLSVAYVTENEFSSSEIDFINVKVFGRKSLKGISKKFKKIDFEKKKWRERWDKGEIHTEFTFKRPEEDKHKKRKIIWEIHLKNKEVFYKVLDVTLIHRHSKYVIFREDLSRFENMGTNIISDLVVNKSVKEKMKVEKTFQQIHYDDKAYTENYGAGILKPMDDGIPRFKNLKEYFIGENIYKTLKVTEHILPNKGGYWTQSEVLKLIPVDVYEFDYCGIPSYKRTEEKKVLLRSYRFLDVEENQLGDDDSIRDRLNEYEKINERIVHMLNNRKEK